MVDEVPCQEDAELGFYEADVDEATMCSLAALRQVRDRLAVAGHEAAARIVDQHAANLVADVLDD